MHPVCVTLFGRPIYWYGVLTATGFLLAVLLWNWLGRGRGFREGLGSEFGFWLMITGITGARIAYVTANWSHFADYPLEILRFDKGGLIYYGGFFGGLLGAILFANRRKISFLTVTDWGVPGLALGHALGRVGCFMNGCCFGSIWDNPLAVSYPPGSEVAMNHLGRGLIEFHQPSLHVHPVQLYETAANLTLVVILTFLFKKNLRAGTVTAVYFTVYPVVRFLNEFLRGDPRLMTGGFTTAQAISFGIFLAGLAIAGWVWLSAGKPAPPTAPKSKS